MVDWFLFAGKPLRNEVPEGDVYRDSDPYFGSLKQESLDMANEFIREQLAVVPDLSSAHKTAMNAYKLYHKTRAKPSGESVRRAKEFMFPPKLHPMICKFIAQSGINGFSARNESR